MSKTIQTTLVIGIVMLLYLNVRMYDKLQVEKEKTCTEIHVVEKELNRVEIAGETYNLDPLMLEAIERLETGNYTSEIYHENYNTWGAFDGTNYLKFDSEMQSTIELARTLRFNYFDKGLDTLEKIGKVYCPTDEKWAEKVKEIYDELKGE